MEKKEKTEECCPKFDPKPWENKIHHWNNKKFIKDKVFTLFNIPINFGAVMKRLDKVVTQQKANIPDWLCLSDHTSKWNMDLYLAVDKQITGSENVTMTGKYFSKVYEGSFKETGKWCKDFEETTKAKKLKTGKLFMWYTTCPKCAKKYGKNYVVILSRIEDK